MPDPSLIENIVDFTTPVLAGLDAIELKSADWRATGVNIPICLDFSHTNLIFPDVIEVNPSGHYYSKSFNTETGAPMLYMLKGMQEMYAVQQALEVRIAALEALHP